MLRITAVFAVLLHLALAEGPDAAWRQKFLEATNIFRAIHNAPPLQLDEGLNSRAQEWATHLSNLGRLEYDANRGPLGVNLYRAQIQTDLIPERPVGAWYADVENYDFSTAQSSNGKTIGHFTQLVWKASTKLGVGFKKTTPRNGFSQYYVVAYYKGGGNVPGQYSSNVAKGLYTNVGPTSSFKTTFLSEHNAHRSMHKPAGSSTVNLVYNTYLNNLAQAWATILASGSQPYDDAEFIGDATDLGQNFFKASPNLPTQSGYAKEAVDSWYNEVAHYNFQTHKSTNAESIDNFSQVVWRETTEVGVGVATSSNGEVFVVALYRPKIYRVVYNGYVFYGPNTNVYKGSYSG